MCGLRRFECNHPHLWRNSSKHRRWYNLFWDKINTFLKHNSPHADIIAVVSIIMKFHFDGAAQTGFEHFAPIIEKVSCTLQNIVFHPPCFNVWLQKLNNNFSDFPSYCSNFKVVFMWIFPSGKFSFPVNPTPHECMVRSWFIFKNISSGKRSY